ncbi:MAG: hypothetical protein Q4P24_16995 [Rhodobacterales bacterium]|nr:hypothetical protein [Rhodobacterales bacterium]
MFLRCAEFLKGLALCATGRVCWAKFSTVQRPERGFRITTAVGSFLLFNFQPIDVAAQYAPDTSLDLGIGYGQMALGQAAISGTRAIGVTSGRAFQNTNKDLPVPSEPVRRSLTFESTSAVTEMVNRRVAAWQSKDHPDMHAEILEDIQSERLQRYFADILHQYHYDSANLADVSAAYYISLWRIIHGRDLTPRQILRIRDQMRAFMAGDAEVMHLSNSEKQEISETFALHSALVLQGYEYLLQAGDMQTLALFRQGLQENLAPQGPDIFALDVSDEGFVMGQ